MAGDLVTVGDDGNGVLDARDLTRAAPQTRATVGAAMAARPEPVLVIGDYHTSSSTPQVLDAAIAAALSLGQTVTAGLEIPADPAWVDIVERRNEGRIGAAAFRDRFLATAAAAYAAGDPRPALFLDRIERAVRAGARVALLDPPSGSQGLADPVMEERALAAWRRHGSDRLFIEAGNFHAQSRPGIDAELATLGVDGANPLGRRLEARLGRDQVFTAATVPADVMGPALFTPPVGTWDAVVRLVRERDEAPAR
jgi:hypothetical protein